jgi:peptidoglycan hydrolase-like amidase
LLDLLDAAPLSEGKSKTRNRSLDAIRPPSELALSIRVGLLSRSPIQFLRTSPTTTCRLADGSFIAVDQLLDVTADASNSARYCKGGVVEINGDSFEGSLELVRSNNGWLAVNEVSLENYVASVVGAEMPSHWHGEALKAQAVAARSYAATHLARPGSQTYHLGDTTRWQVFSGLSSLSQQSLRATDETRGMVLSYRGGLVESLYASTQAISEEAHRHLGASMSQHGAQRLATQGLRFDEILGRYYQGASLAQLQRDGS